jgi:hypothetical protein
MYNDDGNIITRRDVGVDTLVSSVAVWRKGLGVWFGEVGMISLTRHAFDDAGAYRLETAPGRGIPTPAASRVSVRYDVKFFVCFALNGHARSSAMWRIVVAAPALSRQKGNLLLKQSACCL